jgi:hypothetical protein
VPARVHGRQYSTRGPRPQGYTGEAQQSSGVAGRPVRSGGRGAPTPQQTGARRLRGPCHQPVGREKTTPPGRGKSGEAPHHLSLPADAPQVLVGAQEEFAVGHPAVAHPEPGTAKGVADLRGPDLPGPDTRDHPATHTLPQPPCTAPLEVRGCGRGRPDGVLDVAAAGVCNGAARVCRPTEATARPARRAPRDAKPAQRPAPGVGCAAAQSNGGGRPRRRGRQGFPEEPLGPHGWRRSHPRVLARGAMRKGIGCPSEFWFGGKVIPMSYEL